MLSFCRNQYGSPGTNGLKTPEKCHSFCSYVFSDRQINKKNTSCDFHKIFCPAGLTNSSVAIVGFKYVFAYWKPGADVDVGNRCLCNKESQKTYVEILVKFLLHVL